MRPNAAPTITVGKIARPSRPSVRFTALLMPTIIRYAKKTNPKAPRGIDIALKKGTIRVVSADDEAVLYRATAAPIPNTD